MTGTVVYINHRHNWFRVRYLTPIGTLQHETFPIPTADTGDPYKHGFRHHKKPFEWWSKPSKLRDQRYLKD